MISPIARRRCGLAVWALLLLAACRDPARPPDVRACFIETLEVTVGPGTMPEIAWVPACGIASLLVQEISSATAVTKWRIHASPIALLRPPITYGTPPNGSIDIVEVSAVALETGRTYRVTVFSRGLFEFTEAGSATFKP